MHPLQIQIDRIRRRWWLVALVTLAAVAAAVVLAVTAPVLYTGKAALTTASQNRSPDQDAFLAQGYAQYFNEPSYQQLIATEVEVPAEVTFRARTAANSPILYIEAVSRDRELSRTIAGELAGTFREEVRGQLGANKDELLADINRQIADMNRRIDTVSGRGDDRVILLQQLFELQSRANDVIADDSNQLKDLKRDAGVSAAAPSVVPNAVLALLGGLVLGCVAALGLAGLERRITSPREVRDQLDLETLAVVDGRGRGGVAQRRSVQLKGLANVVTLADLPRPTTIAITAARPSAVKSQIAEGLAYYGAAQGIDSLLLVADLHRRATIAVAPGEAGVAEYLAADGAAALAPVAVTVEGSPPLGVVPAGQSQIDPHSLFSKHAFGGLLAATADLADLVVIEAPAVIDAAESQIVCAAADRTILVVEEGATRSRDADQALQLLEKVGATVIGIVIARPATRRGAALLRPAAPGSYVARRVPAEGAVPVVAETASTDPSTDAAGADDADSMVADVKPGPTESDGAAADPVATNGDVTSAYGPATWFGSRGGRSRSATSTVR